MPAISPPPDIPHNSWSSGAAPTALAWSNSSSATVPCPSMISGSSNGGTSTRPCSVAMAAPMASRLSV